MGIRWTSSASRRAKAREKVERAKLASLTKETKARASQTQKEKGKDLVTDKDKKRLEDATTAAR